MSLQALYIIVMACSNGNRDYNLIKQCNQQVMECVARDENRIEQCLYGYYSVSTTVINQTPTSYWNAKKAGKKQDQ